MTPTLIAALAGTLLGSAFSGAVGWYLLRSRSYRMVGNRLVIRFGQVVVFITMCGGLFLLQVFDGLMGIKRHSFPYYAAIYAYLFGCCCVLFFVLRAELRWRKSVGLDRKTVVPEQPKR
jgi:hypothetical protein